MEFREISLARSGDRERIPCHEWLPARSARATVVVVHGLGDHGRALPYLGLSEALVACGHRVISYDQLEHGSRIASDGKRARLHGLVQDLCAVARHARSVSVRTPLVAVGLSMGALVTIRACSENPELFDGLVAASAPLGPVAAARTAMLAATILGRVFPGLPLGTGMDMTMVTDNREDLSAYVSDPLFQTRTRMGLASDLLGAAKELRLVASTMQVPTLFLHGKLDVIAPWPEGLVASLQGEERVVKVFEHGHHNLFLDVARRDVFDAIIQWTSALCDRVRAREGGGSDA